MDNKEIKFIAQHYKSGCFSADKAWSAMGIHRNSWWTRSRVAATVALTVGLTATATIFINRRFADNASAKVEIKQENVISNISASAVKTIDFEDTVLPDVIKTIKDVYGVKIENIPSNASDYRLSLHYEGDVDNLVATINEILDIQLTVKKK